MRLNSAFTSVFSNRWVVVSGAATVLVAIFILGTSFTSSSDRTKQTNLLIRQIGHRLLLQAGDSASQVLPVTENGGTFILRFESEFVFSHDSLMALSRRQLSQAQFPSGYTVTVHDCAMGNIVYGFQISHTSTDILSCQGRNQRPGCYRIEFAFGPLEQKANTRLVYSGILLLLGVTLLIGRFLKAPSPVPNQANTIQKEPVPEFAALGKFLFDTKGQRLLLGKDAISLTDKECRILELFNENFGELITRETLMQKVWIDEGVITGRSLDMFVSKLRKKLSGDPALRITNVHGKGYKLEQAEIQS